MGKKDKKSLDESQAEDANEPSYEDRLQYVSVIAEPMASKKLAKKVTVSSSCNLRDSYIG